MNQAQARRHLVRICKALYDRFYLVATDGNVSIRLGENEILTTPSGANKGFLEPEDLVLTDRSGRPLGNGRPSSELAMHRLVYDLRPDVRAVVHAHPRAATAFAAAGKPLDSCLMTESVCGLGQIPLAPLALPSTAEVSDSIRDLIPQTSTILLESHGALAYGKDLMEAYNRMEGIEQFAQVQLRVLALGGGSIEGKRALELLALRPGYGLHDPILPCMPDPPPQESPDTPAARTLARLKGFSGK